MKPEAAIQSALIEWWNYAHKGFCLKDSRCLFMVPNGAYLGAGMKTLGSGKSVSLAAIRFHQLKRQGFVNGVADLLLIVPRGDYHGLALEMKAPKGRVSDDQEQMMAVFQSHGWQAMCAWSFDEGVRAITNYLNRGDALKNK
jgi:hypothetical protein